MECKALNNVKHYASEDTYLIVIPRYYFGNQIAFWQDTEVGKYYHELLSQRTQKHKGIYIYHTEDGDAEPNISQILKFIQGPKKTLLTSQNFEFIHKIEEPLFTFAQCFTCNRVATVASQPFDFNFILMLCGNCTKYCHDCYFT